MFRSPFDDDPFFRDSMEDMHRMMGMHHNMMWQPELQPQVAQRYASHGRRHTEPNNMEVSPFGMMNGMFGGGLLGGSMFGGMDTMMRNMEQSMRAAQTQQGMPGSSFHSSFTSVSYGSGDGQPKVYKSSSSARVGPNGVKETQKTEENSETGLRRMAVGHHIDSRSHVIEKSRNSKTGDCEESQEFVNLDEEDAENFSQEFKEKIRSSAPPQRHRSIMHHQIGRHHPSSSRHLHEPRATSHHLPSGNISSSGCSSERQRPPPQPRRGHY